MRKETIKLSEIISSNILNKINKTSITFLLYFKIWKEKGGLINQNIPQEQIFSYLNNSYMKESKEKMEGYFDFIKSIRDSSKLISIEKVVKEVDDFLDECKKYYPKTLSKRIIDNWNEFGYPVVKKEYLQNKIGIEKVVNYIDEVNDFDVIDIVDLYELLNPSGRFLNDFFTPNEVGEFMGKLMTIQQIEKLSELKEVNLYDPAFGISRLIIHSFYKIKTQFKTKKINIYGVDINSHFVVFSSSILELINFGNNTCVCGNTLFIEPNFPKMDIIVGNPPFGKMSKYDLGKLIQIDNYNNGNRIKNSSNSVLNINKNLKQLSKEEYESIINNYKVV
jgi:hypothetical protein